MKKVLLILVLGFLTMSCVKSASVPDPVSNFNYSMVKEVMTPFIDGRSVLQAVDVYDGDKLVAENLSEAIPVIVGMRANLTTQPTGYKNSDGTTHIYFPGENQYGTMMFEDLFPSKGDYDMNDVVFQYRFMFATTNDVALHKNLINAITIDIKPMAVGAAGDELIGLAMVIHHPRVRVKTVERTGLDNMDFSKLFVMDTKEARGGAVEQIPDDAEQVIIPLTSDFRSHFGTNQGMYNVRKSQPGVEAQEFSVTVNLEKKVPIDEYTIFGANADKMKYNVDIFAIFDVRGREVHLKNMEPTVKFDHKYFTYSDAAARKNFSAPDNSIWALTVPQTIKHPIETGSGAAEKNYIEWAYPEFAAWVASEGRTNQFWHASPNFEYCY